MPNIIPKSLATITAALIAGIVLLPTSADAARLTKAEKAAWNRANVSCKAEGKGKRLEWLKRRKFVKACIIETLKGYPNIDVEKIMKAMDTGRLPVHEHGNAM